MNLIRVEFVSTMTGYVLTGEQFARLVARFGNGVAGGAATVKKQYLILLVIISDVMKTVRDSLSPVLGILR